MDLSLLAVKQKRLANWQRVLQEQVVNADLKRTFFDSLKAYRNLLTKIWREGTVTGETAQELADLERTLDQLDERARLRTASH